jgi:hypothetical protein
MIAFGILIVICIFVPLGVLYILDEVADFLMSWREFFK